MTVHSVIEVAAVMMTFTSAWFLLRSDHGLSARSIVKLSSRHLRDQEIVGKLCRQRANTRVGFALLLISAFAQVRILFTGGNWENIGPPSGLEFGVGLAIALVVLIFATLTASRIARKAMDEVVQLRLVG